MKRKNGEGSWGEKTIKGVVYKYFRDPNGKYFYGKTQKEIKEKIKKHEESSFVNIRKDDSLFGEYMKSWLYNVKQKSVKRRTFDGYEEYFLNNVVNFDGFNISDMKIQKITPENMTEYFNSMAEKYALSTIKKTQSIINQCFEYAVDNKVIPENPCLRATIPSEDNVAKPRKEIPFLTIEDIEKLYNVSNLKQVRINKKKDNEDLIYGNNAKIIVLIMYTGLRISEALGLKWSDIDFANKQLHVKRNLSRVKNRTGEGAATIMVETTLKRESSKRTIPLANRAIEALEYLKEHTNYKSKNDYVCSTSKGTLATARNITRTLQSMLIRGECEVEQCGLHSLRHSFGSYLLSKNVEISVISRLLGHKDISVTYKIYIHVLKQSQIDAIKVFDIDINNIDDDYNDNDDEG